jgi:plasmid stability protein
MPVHLSIKNVPDDIAAALRSRAESNHRSLQGELMAILESALSSQPAGAAAIETRGGAPRPGSAQPAARRPAPKLSIDEVAARATQLFPKGTPDSTDFIRAMRDGRYGTEWAKTGRHDSSD